MDVTIRPAELQGTVAAIPSKSMAHRLLICAALADAPTKIVCPSSSDDIDATASCLEALGAHVARGGDGFFVAPVREPRAGARLDCGESGSTLRFLLPVAAALGAGALFDGRGRLPERPLSPLREQLEAHGVTLSAPGAWPLAVSGRLAAGSFELPGNVSSQFVSGLLLAAPAAGAPVAVRVAEPVESRPYIDLTMGALEAFGAETANARADGACAFAVRSPRLSSPGTLEVEGDWSAGAFWLAAGALSGGGVAVRGLRQSSRQGDRAVLGALAMLGAHVSRTNTLVAASASRLAGCRLNVADHPDLVPPLALVAALAEGDTTIFGARRLRLKESDRLASVSAALAALGARVEPFDDGLRVRGVGLLRGGEVDSAGDHRIAMMAAVAACFASGPTVIHGAECVSKSYPGFFDDLASLGGVVELREGEVA